MLAGKSTVFPSNPSFLPKITGETTDQTITNEMCLLGLIVVSIVGNTLAIHTLMRKRMRKKRSSYLFLNLAMADCLVTIFPMAGMSSKSSGMADVRMKEGSELL